MSKLSMPQHYGLDFKINDVVKSELKNSSRAWIILCFAWSFYLYEYILRVSASVMTQQLMVDFNVTAASLGVLASFYYLAYVPLQVPCGVIVDWLGARRVVSCSALFCAMGAFMFSESSTLTGAQLGRFLMGAGSACAYISCMKIATQWFSSDKFALISGIGMFMGTLGGTFGGRPFAILVNTYGWKISMLIFACIGGGIASLCWFFIRDNPERKESFLESKTEAGDLLKGLKVIISNPQSWLIALYGCMMYLPLSAFAELWGVPFLMQYYGIGNEVAALGSIMVFVGMGSGCIAAAFISNKLKSRTRVMSGSAILTLLCFLFVFYGPNVSFHTMLGVLFLGGFVSGGQILYFTCAKEVNPKRVSATAIGFTNCGVMVSGLVFQPLLGYILDLSWKGSFNPDGTRFYDLYCYQMAFGAVSLALVISWFIARQIKETYPKDISC